MSISIRLMSAALAGCAAQLCGCSNFACCYTELSPEQFQKKAMFHGIEYTILHPVGYRGSDERFAYFEFNRFLWFPELIKTPKRDFETQEFQFGRFPNVQGVYYKRQWTPSLLIGNQPLTIVPIPQDRGGEEPAEKFPRQYRGSLQLKSDGQIQLDPPQVPPPAPIDMDLAGKKIEEPQNPNTLR